MKNVRSRLAFWLYIIVLVTAVFSLVLSALARNGVLFQRDPLRWSLFGFALKDILLLLMALAAISALVRLATRSTTNPIRDLSRAAQEIARGNFDITVDIRRDNLEEFGELERSFNTMARELRANEYLQKDFVSNVSHQLKTPLSILSGYARLLTEETLTDEERREYARYVADESDQLVKLIDNMLRLSRIDHREIMPRAVSFPLGEELRRAVLELDTRREAARLELDADIQDVDFVGDSELLYQVWINLLDNAVKFSLPGGTVRVGCHGEGDTLRITVADEGIGMDEETQKRVFERFYQGDTEQRAQGSGLGLPLARRIVEMHEGTLTVESEVGHGCCFTVLLPVRKEAVKTASR